MTDRELLEFAAKAVGGEYVEHTGFDDDTGSYVTHSWLRIGGQLLKWNPRDDDGDALRLAVKLKLDINYGFSATQINISKYNWSEETYDVEIAEDGREDPYAATRLAILCAAAKLGKEMK